MATSVSNERMERIFYLIDKNRFSLKIDSNPSREKIERIKTSIERKKQLFEKTIAHHQKS